MSKKSLLSVLSGRSRATEQVASTSASASKKQVKGAPTSTIRARRPVYDDKTGGPSPPRGSLTRDKLSYLDWRLQRINVLRHSSENTTEPWIDGRTTIGRNSFDVRQPQAVVEDTEVTPAVAVSEPLSLPPVQVNLARFYADEKDAATKALAHAADSIVASMPRLAKQDSSSCSESDLSGHSDPLDQQTGTAQCAKQVVKTTRSIPPKRLSLLRRASRHLTFKSSSTATRTSVSVTHMPQAHFSSASSHNTQRDISSLARHWQH